MSYYESACYVNAGDGATTGYYAVAKWSAMTICPPGTIRRQTAPALGSERCFVAVQLNQAGSTGTTEPTWVVTRGARTSDIGVSWQEITGVPALNGDLANTPTWAQAKLTAATASLGTVIKRNNGVSIQVCITSGNIGASEPAFSDTPGTATADGTATWACIFLASAMPAPFSAPHSRFANSIVANWGAAGNDFYFGDNHFENLTATTSFNFGTVALPCRVISADHTVMPVAWKSGATIQVTMSTANQFSINSTGSAYINGFTFISNCNIGGGVMQVGGNAVYGKFEGCSFQLGPACLSTSTITIGPGGQFEGMGDFINCTWSFSNAAQQVYWTGGWYTYRNTPTPCFLGTISTQPFRAYANTPAAVLFEGIDFTSLGSGTLWAASFGGGFVTIKNCKLHTGPVIAAITLPAAVVLQIDLVNCDAGGNIWRNERHNYYGDQYTSWNGGSPSVYSVYRTGGAMDGTQPVCHYIVPTSPTKNWRPFQAIPYVIWNNVIGSPVTVTLYGSTTFTFAVPTIDMIYFEVEYMGDTGSPLASMVKSSAPVADSVSTWPNITPTHANFSMSATFTPQKKGYITIYPKVIGSSAYYLDPLPVLS